MAAQLHYYIQHILRLRVKERVCVSFLVIVVVLCIKKMNFNSPPFVTFTLVLGGGNKNCILSNFRMLTQHNNNIINIHILNCYLVVLSIILFLVYI